MISRGALLGEGEAGIYACRGGMESIGEGWRALGNWGWHMDDTCEECSCGVSLLLENCNANYNVYRHPHCHSLRERSLIKGWHLVSIRTPQLHYCISEEVLGPGPEYTIPDEYAPPVVVKLLRAFFPLFSPASPYKLKLRYPPEKNNPRKTQRRNLGRVSCILSPCTQSM